MVYRNGKLLHPVKDSHLIQWKTRSHHRTPGSTRRDKYIAYFRPKSLTARPAAAKFSNRISEYSLERITPAAPPLNAAMVAAYVSPGEAFLLFSPVGILISI